jgi:hypothetical protein
MVAMIGFAGNKKEKYDTQTINAWTLRKAGVSRFGRVLKGRLSRTYRSLSSERVVGHSENGELSLGGGLFKAQRCFGFKPTVVPTSR